MGSSFIASLRWYGLVGEAIGLSRRSVHHRGQLLADGIVVPLLYVDHVLAHYRIRINAISGAVIIHGRIHAHAAGVLVRVAQVMAALTGGQGPPIVPQ